MFKKVNVFLHPVIRKRMDSSPHYKIGNPVLLNAFRFPIDLIEFLLLRLTREEADLPPHLRPMWKFFNHSDEECWALLDLMGSASRLEVTIQPHPDYKDRLWLTVRFCFRGRVPKISAVQHSIHLTFDKKGIVDQVSSLRTKETHPLEGVRRFLERMSK